MATKKVLFTSPCVIEGGAHAYKGHVRTYDDTRDSNILASLVAGGRIVAPVKANVQQAVDELSAAGVEIPADLAEEAKAQGVTIPAKRRKKAVADEEPTTPPGE